MGSLSNQTNQCHLVKAVAELRDELSPPQAHELAVFNIEDKAKHRRIIMVVAPVPLRGLRVPCFLSAWSLYDPIRQVLLLRTKHADNR